MAFTNAETKLPKLLLDYVHSRREELELPNEATLPFIEQMRTAERTFPCVAFYISDFILPHPLLFRCVLQVELMVNAHDTAPEDETSWAAAIRHAVSDRASFLESLAALNEAQRTGWTLTKYRVLDGGVTLIADAGLRVRRTTALAFFRCDETTP